VARARRIGAALLGAIVLALVLAQLLLPKIAASRIASHLRKYGSVHSVSVSSWPALELLWRHADSVNVRAGSLRVTPNQTGKLLGEARGAGRIDMTASNVRLGPLILTDVRLRKQGDAAGAQALISEANVRAALPAGVSVQLVSSGAGQVRVRVSGALFGIDASLDAVAQPSDGKLVVHPVGFPFEGLSLTLVDQPHVYVEGVSASATTAPNGARSYRLGISGRLR
jgi:LmeA-like phospholipid-binding